MSFLKTVTIVIKHEERQARAETPCHEWPTIGSIFKDVAMVTDGDSVYVATLCIPTDREEFVIKLAEEKGYFVRPDMMEAFRKPVAGNTPSGPAL